MRQITRVSFSVFMLAALAACGRAPTGEEVDRSFQGVNVVDETNLNDVMLTVGDPNEAVTYFQRAAAEDPDRIELQRGLAKSLVKAKRVTEARSAWARVVENPASTSADRVDYADALIRANDWEGAKKVLAGTPPTFESHKRYKLEAMVADADGDWAKADSYYETAVGLTTTPGGTLNNWGYSKLTRGEYGEAERLFIDAIRRDQSLFTAKNNLALARAAQGEYTLPVIPMTQTERAQLLHTMGLAAIKRGDVEIGKGLLRDAVETHPQHFDAASRALSALENGGAG